LLFQDRFVVAVRQVHDGRFHDVWGKDRRHVGLVA
jgi:hypothetical protein